MAMDLQPCAICPGATYSTRLVDGRTICDPCLDALTYVQSAPVDDLRDLIANGGTR